MVFSNVSPPGGAVWFFVVIFVGFMLHVFAQNSAEDAGRDWLLQYNKRAITEYNLYMNAMWDYNTNLTEFNKNKSVLAKLRLSDFKKEAAKNASRFNWKRFSNATMRREFHTISDIGVDALNDTEKVKQIQNVQNALEEIYSNGKLCNISKKGCITMETGIEELLATSRDYNELLAVWKGWRDVTGRKMKDLYETFVQLKNEGIHATGEYNDTSQWWKSWYEVSTFEADMEQLLEDLKPLYVELHTYIRDKLQEFYSQHEFPKSGHIPAHLLGNMWSQTWNNIIDIVKPYKDAVTIDITPALRQQNYTVLKMFRVSEQFFASLGFPNMTEEFWKNSMLVQPGDGRKVVCHASAWDMYNSNGKDFRIKWCTVVNMEDLITVHHEMGHIAYYMMYKDQPISFRGGANPGFHEAIGDLMVLSVVTPEHLSKIGLLKKVKNDTESDINYLMDVALRKIAFLPFGYLIDQWRWSVFRGETTKDQYNTKWWNLRCKYQGIYPPVERTEEDFDPGAKYHIPGDTPYIRYFVSYVIQFQFHKALCDKAGHTGPLHRCDIYQSKKAGEILRRALSMGSSQPWPDVMEVLTGQRNISVAPIKEFFKPLIEWLQKQNQGKGKGWIDGCPSPRSGLIEDEVAAYRWLERYEVEAQEVYYRSSVAEWRYNTNITDYNEEVQVNVSLQASQFEKKSAEEANAFDWKNFKDKNLTRQFMSITNIGTSALTDMEKLAQLKKVQAEMEGIYSKANVCLSNGQCHQIEPGLTRLMSTSDNYTLLAEAWDGWRDATGKKMKEKYRDYVELSNEAIGVLGYNDTGEYWRSWYETPTFQTDLQGLLTQLSPLYENLHAYVRRKLKEKFGAEYFPESGHIPAHLLGNMWAQQWNNIEDILRPFPNKKNMDVTQKMKNLGWNATKLFRVAEEFFLSLGLKAMPENFWRNSMIVKPKGREVVCHASAWDFYNRHDYRIKMCTDITMEDLITIHHEMGHIQYYLQYMDQPVSYREGANPGFHEAVGDVMALSVSTPEHLKKINLLDSIDNDTDADLNFLMSMALEKIAFLPFGYLIDQWRWSVFSGETPPAEYNDKWWKLRCKYQGISPPVMRSAEDFDPGAKYHIPANVPYIRYFVSFVIQFQFHKALCEAAGQHGPLHRCDIYQNKNAGKKLSDMLSVGSSIPWQDAMEKITGQRDMSAQALMEYFQPLTDWLKRQNENHPIGWDDTCPNTRSLDVAQAKQWLQEYNTMAEVAKYVETEAEWAYASNITDETQRKQVEARLVLAEFNKEAARNASIFDWKNFKDKTIRREFSKIADIGTDALADKNKLKQLNQLQSDIEGIYAKGEVCLQTRGCLKLEPELVRVMATSRNHSELLEAWQGWRKATGRKMKDKYAEFAKLSNEGVRELGYNDTGAYWRSSYESPTFQQDLQKLLDQLKPFYEQLHTYVRSKLIEVYGEENFPTSGQIPAHLLGNMWAQTWNNIYDILIPFKNKTSVDVTEDMKQQNYTPYRMFRTAESFFKSLNLSEMPQPFWDKSMIVKPLDGRDVVCHASAWDFYNRRDFRIKMCTAVTMEDLITIHHEMGHIQYFLQYKDQPVAFRDGANPGFHEAIGDTMALSVSTPKHLHSIGLLKTADTEEESELNFLMSMALDKIAFLPFGYLIDQWRWSVFSGETPKDKYNEKWWQLRCKYQGVSPPYPRTMLDFDPGAKYHIPANTPYIRYFVSYVIQFQFHKGLCEAAGHNGSLHRCDIYNSTAAGKKLGDVLKLGSSKPWPEAMKAITGHEEMSAEAILDYFKPLTDWLKKQNAGKKIGWEEECALPRRLMTSDLPEAIQWLEEYNEEAQREFYIESEAEWTYATNITDENSKKEVEARLKLSKFEKAAAKNASHFKYEEYTDERIKRQFKKIKDIGTSALEDEEKLKKLNSLQSEIEGVYGKGTVCLEPNQCLPLEPDLYRIMSSSRNYTVLEKVWKGWRDATGKLMKEKYAEFAQISNEGVQELGYADTGAYWRSWYETDTFEQDLVHLLDQLKPLYEQLHTYVRRKLVKLYGPEHFPETGHIPAHLLGNMWAQEWQNLYDLMEPFKGKVNVDVTNVMRARNYTAERMFRTAEDFFVSLGLNPMPQSFWDRTMMVKPGDGREVVCHASAWDFYNQKDFRIKMCTDITMEDLVTIHHEMGHIQYYLQYKNQPVSFRRGANPGFHEAIGDTMALSAATPKHLHKIGLLETLENDQETDINFLMKMALEKIAFLPFGYLIDQWRWSVFSGETPKDKYNEKWWQLRCKYQGIAPPVPRSEEDFDPGAKYHIPANTPYIRYFVSFVIQFQFHKALCEAAGQHGPLYQCDIYNSTAAGKKLGDMLRLGSSRPWPEAMEALTGQRHMDATAILDYFKPLADWLEKQNKGELNPGWTEQCPGVMSQHQDAERWLESYEPRAAVENNLNANTQWNYETNITQYNQEVVANASLRFANFRKEAARNASSFNLQSIQDPILRRRLKFITDIGTDALSSQEELKKLTSLVAKMSELYSTANVNVNGKQYSLEPGLTRILAESTNYRELLQAWKGFRDDTGPKIKPLYMEFVYLSNKAVKELGYSDTGEYWRSWYETPTFQTDLQGLLTQLSPLYENLHTYVRKKLRSLYGADKFPASGHIPAHLLGNMWAQKWDNIYHLVVPFKNKQNSDVTNEMKRQNYTVERMFRTSEEFFSSIGMFNMTEAFWSKSMIHKPGDRKVVCHASAWDFSNKKDFRIKMCTVVNLESLIVIHHEMGHIEYYMAYRDQPVEFRQGANNGFHEAVGDVIALSVSTPSHLHKIGLMPTEEHDSEAEINFLMKMALEKVAFLPFGYLIDQWRWSVFSRETLPKDFNAKWWELRCKYQGISPPVERTESDFDPGAKYHIPANYAYIRYFVSYVIQFQFHKALCDAAGYKGPLHQCDIYQSKAAGKKLHDMLKLGSSIPWPDAMERITGQRKMDVGPLLQYFKPLIDWLKKENQNEHGGWNSTCPKMKTRQQKPQQTSNTMNSAVTLYISWEFIFLCFIAKIAMTFQFR